MAVSVEKSNFDKFSIIVSDTDFSTVREYKIQDNCAIRMELSIAARQMDGYNRATFKRVMLIYRQNTGPVTLQGKLWHTSDTIKSHNNIDIRYLLGPDSIVFQVRNAGSIPTKWNGITNIIKVK